MRCAGHCVMFALHWTLTFHTILIRWLFAYFAFRLLGFEVEAGRSCASIFAILPLLRSALAMVAPLSPGPFFRWRHGYRLPSKRERDQIGQMLATFRETAKRPSRVLILDGPGFSSFTIGTTTVLERGLLAAWLQAGLAQQVGFLNATMTRAHLAHWWSKYQVLGALGDALDPPTEDDPTVRIGLLRRLLGRTFRLLAGNSRFVNWPDRWVYPSLLKRDFYAADRWAASHFGSHDLVDFLSAFEQPTDFAVPYPWLSSQPSAENRIARISKITDTHQL